MKVLGRTIVGIRGFEFDKEIEKEILYGAGDEGIDITTGNKKITGTLKLYKYEVDLLNDAAKAAGYGDITEVPYTLIVLTCAFKLNATTPSRTITIPGLGFTKMTFTMDQNAKYTEVPLPWVATKMVLV